MTGERRASTSVQDCRPERLCDAVDDVPDYVVIAGPGRVDTWSVRRLPFEPKGSMLALRTELRSALDGLSATGSLHAVYSTGSPDFCDAENVLIYNVGPSRFTRLAARRLTFERAPVVPDCSATLSGPPLHHHGYTTSGGPGFAHWRTDKLIASGRASLPRSTEKPADWWWHVRTGVRTDEGRLMSGAPFALRLRLRSRSVSIPAILKPLLDGLIAALQSDASPSDAAVSRLAEHLAVSAETVRGHLTTPGVLQGQGALVRAYRSGLQWNPADDLCIACTVERADDGADRELDWELLGVSPRSA